MSKEEKEIKIELLIPIEDFVSRAKDYGFSEKGKIVQIDSYYDSQDWRLYKSVAALRIREVNGKKHSYAFKKVFHIPNRSKPYYVEEIEGRFPINDSEHVRSIFERLNIGHNGDGIIDSVALSKVLTKSGYTCEQVMRKTRRILSDDNDNEIVIDDIDRVGRAIELECVNDNPLDLASKLLSENEWKPSIVGTSYMWLEKMKGFKLHNQFGDMFNDRPDWNVWDNEREAYTKLTRQV